MSPIVHGMIAWLFAVAFLKTANDRRLVVIAGVAADIDGIFSLISMHSFMEYHHTFGHSFAFGLPLAITAGALAKEKQKVIPVALGTFSLHLAADIIGTNWPVNPLYPLSESGFSIGTVLSSNAIYYVIDPIAFVIILVSVIAVSFRKEFSPVEFISEKYDKQLVEYYVNPLKYQCEICGLRAFIKCAECGKRVCPEHTGSVFVRRCAACKRVK